jgi:lysophospholipase L1-like esterase
MYRIISSLSFALLLVACGGGPQLPPLADDAVLLAFGDSLTRGSGAGEGDSYPAVLARRLDRTVVNAGIPGEESAEGLARLPGVLDEVQPDLLLLCHGGNDLLRKRSTERLKANLRSMVAMARSAGMEVVLIGVPKPGLFLGTHPLYRELADELGLAIEDQALGDILGDSALKSDSIHPNAAGYEALAAAVQGVLIRTGAVAQ